MNNEEIKKNLNIVNLIHFSLSFVKIFLNYSFSLNRKLHYSFSLAISVGFLYCGGGGLHHLRLPNLFTFLPFNNACQKINDDCIHSTDGQNVNVNINKFRALVLFFVYLFFLFFSCCLKTIKNNKKINV